MHNMELFLLFIEIDAFYIMFMDGGTLVQTICDSVYTDLCISAQILRNGNFSLFLNNNL